MKYLLNIKGIEYEAKFVRFRDADFRNGNRSTVTIVTELSYAEVVELFSDPSEWSLTQKHELEPDIVTDCTGYDVLCSIRDNRDGLLEVVMGKITDSEALAELREVLDG